MDMPFIVFLLIFAVLVVAIISQAKDRSGKRIGKDTGRLVAYGIACLVVPLITGQIPYLILSTSGFENATATAVAIAVGVVGMALAYAFLGEWIERTERTRERKVEQARGRQRR